MMASPPNRAEQTGEKSWTVQELLAWTKSFFEKKQIESPRLNAELLLAHSLHWQRIQLYTQFDAVVKPEQLAAFKELILQRAEHRPIQYILGACEFFSLEFRVTPDVLIPRPETEFLVQALIDNAKELPEAQVLEIGTGSGCIVIAAATKLPQARFTTVDISQAALEVATENAQKHAVADCIRFLHGDLYEPVQGETFDLIVSNPPYISEADWKELMPEVRDYEPRSALVAGEDGLDAYRRLISGAVEHLNTGGKLMLELPAGGASKVLEIAEQAGLTHEATIPDLQKIERVLILSSPRKENTQD